MDFVNLLIVCWLAACAYSDWRTRRVPNTFTYGFCVAAALALVLQGQTLTGTSWQQGLLGFAMAALLTLPGFVLNRLGGGDVKLLLGLGLASGPQEVIVTFVAGTLVLVLAVLVRQLSRPLAPAGEAAAPLEWPFVPGLLAGYLLVAWDVPGLSP